MTPSFVPKTTYDTMQNVHSLEDGYATDTIVLDSGTGQPSLSSLIFTNLIEHTQQVKAQTTLRSMFTYWIFKSKPNFCVQSISYDFLLQLTPPKIEIF